MTVEEASKILKMLLGFLKGEIEPPSPKTIEEAEKFEKEGYECLNMAIRSLEAWVRVKEELHSYTDTVYLHSGKEAITMEAVYKIINTHLKEVKNEADN